MGLTSKSVNCGGGSFLQTLFMGATIRGYTAQIGWNGEIGSIDVRLEEDKCTTTTKYYIDGGNSTIQSTTDADVFDPPKVGQPCYFEYGTFSFAGLLQNWYQVNDSNQGRQYQVKVIDPRLILSNTQIITGGYSGPTRTTVFPGPNYSNGSPNILNPYGFYEQFHQLPPEGSSCPLDSSLIALMGYDPTGGAGGFGGAQSNQDGMTWDRVVNTLVMLTAAPGGLTTAYGGPSLSFRSIEYYLDISEVPSNLLNGLLPGWYRVRGENNDLLSIIQDVCQEAGFDFFVELNLIPGANPIGDPNGKLDMTTNLQKIIKIHAVNRFVQPTGAEAVDSSTADPDTRLALGAITAAAAPPDWTSNGFTTDTGDELKNVTRGLELRYDEITQSMLTGEFRHDVWQTIGGGLGLTARIWPFWGTDSSTGAPIIGLGINNAHAFDADSTAWSIGTSTYEVTVGELRAAMESESLWRDYVITTDPSKASTYGIDGQYLGFGVTSQALLNNAINANKGFPRDAVNADQDAAAEAALLNLRCNGSQYEQVEALVHRLYDHVHKLATEYYGRKFMVRLYSDSLADSIICVSWETQTGEPRFNWEPAQEGGWVNDIDAFGTSLTVLGIPPSNAVMECIKTEDGRIKAFVKFGTADYYDTSQVDPNSMFIYNGDLYVACTVEDDYVWTGGTPGSGDPRAVITLAGPVFFKYCLYAGGSETYLPQHQRGVDEIADINMMNQGNVAETMKKPGANQVNFSYGPAFLMPTAAAIPLRSNNLTYGPWFATNGYSGLDPLIPARPGAINAALPDGKTNYSRDATYSPWGFGSDLGMGVAALLRINSEVTNTMVVEYGTVEAAGSPAFSLGDVLLIGGPNITNIDVTVNPEAGVSTGYRMRTFTPKFGVALKQAVDGIKKMGILQRKHKRAYNLALLDRFSKITQNMAAARLLGGLQRNKRTQNTTSHTLIFANVTEDNEDSNWTRTDVETGELAQELGSLYDNYEDDMAAVDFGGLFRPFSTGDTQSHMPGFVDSPDSDAWYSRGHVGPIEDEDHPRVNVTTMNPFQTDETNFNTGSSISGGGIFGTSTEGHDIEYVIRDAAFPTNLNIRTPSDDYGTDYRSIALRGPLVIVGWGYDIHDKPVPNSDPESPTMDFEDDFLRKPHKWKAGPVDLRWDEDRGMWVAPPAFKICRAKTCEPIAPGGYGPAYLPDEDNQTDKDGNDISKSCCSKGGNVNNRIVLYNNTTHFIRANWYCSAYYCTTDDKWYIISFETPLCKCTAYPDPLGPDCEDGDGGGTDAILNAVYFTSAPPDFDVADIQVTIQNDMDQPIDSGQVMITYPVSSTVGCNPPWTETHIVLQAQFQQLEVVTNVECEEGDDDLIVCDTKVPFEGRVCEEDCPDPEG